jgi:hypothetical protein
LVLALALDLLLLRVPQMSSFVVVVEGVDMEGRLSTLMTALMTTVVAVMMGKQEEDKECLLR